MELRRQHRIVYQSKIILSTAGRANSVVARVQNLSPLGVFVTTSAADLPRPGSLVLCRFTLARQSRTVRGRVAWVREISKKSPLKSPGAGIEFLELEERDVDLLRRLVDPGDDERQPVDVWFEGMPAAVRCQATVAGEEVRLATRLPFMRLHSPVRISFVDQPGAVVREGTLDSVMLESNDEFGVPHLRLSISTAVLDNARGTIDVQSAASAGGSKVVLASVPQASTVIDPAVVIAPTPSWLTFGSHRPGEFGQDKKDDKKDDGKEMTGSGDQGFSEGFLARATLSLWAEKASSASRAGLFWLGGGWRPLVLGCVTGALLVSVLWSLF
jgi:PilZ domain